LSIIHLTKWESMALNFLNKIYFVSGFLFLFFMLVFPSVFQEIKYISMFFLIITGIIEWIGNSGKINKWIFISLLIWFFYFLSSLLLGILNNFKVDFVVVSIYFVTPILAFLFSSIINNNTRFICLNRMLIYITFVICIIDIVYILNITDVIALPFEIKSKIFGSVELSSEKVEFRITNQSSLMFLLPYLIAIFYSKGYNSIGEKRFILLTILLGVILSILSGRRALEFVVFIAFLLTFLLIKFKKNSKPVITKAIIYKRIKNFFLIFGLIILFLFNFFDNVEHFFDFINSVYETFMRAFSSKSVSGSIRNRQSIALFEGWAESPLFGHGLNSNSKDVIRSLETPWSYEQVYQALLFQTGILGFGLFLTYVILIAINLYYKVGKLELIENKYFLGILVGFICFIIAGSTNPLVYYVWAWTFALISYQKSINLDNA